MCGFDESSSKKLNIDLHNISVAIRFHDAGKWNFYELQRIHHNSYSFIVRGNFVYCHSSFEQAPKKFNQIEEGSEKNQFVTEVFLIFLYHVYCPIAHK